MARPIKLTMGPDPFCGGKKENAPSKIEISDPNEIMLPFFLMFFDNSITKVSEARDCPCR